MNADGISYTKTLTGKFTAWLTDGDRIIIDGKVFIVYKITETVIYIEPVQWEDKALEYILLSGFPILLLYTLYFFLTR